MLIKRLNGDVIDISNFNLKRLFHYIPSAEVNHTSASVEGRSDIITDTKLNNRIITVQFLYDSQDIVDYYLLRDELNALFLREEAFYIIFKKEPHKQYLVKTNSQFSIPPNPHMEAFEVEFITLNTYGEFVFSTGELTSKEWDVDQFGWNGIIDWDSENLPQYTFTERNFTVLNLGNVAIDPRQSYLRIELRGIGPATSITNNTTGDVYTFTDSLTSSDTLILQGVQTFKNDISSFRNTNRRIITLAPGENDFFVGGLSGGLQSISFDFRYLYK